MLGRQRVKQSRRRFKGWSALVRGLLGALTLLAIAEALTRLEIVSPRDFPHASIILERMVELLTDGEFMLEVWATVQGWMLALGLAILISVPLGMLLASSRVTFRATSAVIEVLRPVPPIALLPLAVLVWGQGTSMKVILVAYATIWPILYNTIYGVRGVDPVTIETARAFGLPRRAILRRVILPSAAPFILTGIRISASLGLVIMVGAELIAGASSGIGTFILQSSLASDATDVVLASAAVAGLLGVAINGLFSVLEHRAFAWSARGQNA